MHAKRNRNSDCGTPRTSTNVAECMQNTIETVSVGLLGLQLMLLNAGKHTIETVTVGLLGVQLM